MSKILLLEDDISLVDGLKYSLKKNGFEAEIVRTVSEALNSIENIGKYDLLILDVTLPDGTGFDVCEAVRRQGQQVPIIFLTASDEEVNIIRGLDSGGDDYITKPFSMPILKRKIAAILRRTSGHTETEKYLRYKNVTLDLDGYKAFVDGNDTDLTAKEFEVLREFLLNQGRVYTRQNLLNILWNCDFYVDERIIDTHIKNIRKKLGVDIIETIRGVGYRIAKENKS